MLCVIRNKYFRDDFARNHKISPHLDVSQLFGIASERGAIDCLRELFIWTEACRLEIESKELDKILGLAAVNGHIEVAELLIEKGANHLLIDDKTFKSTRFDILDARPFNATEFLCGLNWKRPILAQKLLFGSPTLHEAVQDGRESVVEALLYQLPDIDMRDNSEETALMKAAKEDHSTIAQLLMDVGADPFAAITDCMIFDVSVGLVLPQERLAIHFAAENGHCEVLQALINSINYERHAVTALKLALENEHHDVVKLLLEEAIHPDLYSDGLESAIHFAASSTDLSKALSAILEHLPFRRRELCINLKSSRGRTALHVAVKEGNVEATKTLIQFEADVNEMDNQDKSPLFYAAGSEKIQILTLLLDSGALYPDYDPAVFEAFGGKNSLLFNAAKWHNVDSVKLLLERCPVDLSEINLVELAVQESEYRRGVPPIYFGPDKRDEILKLLRKEYVSVNRD